MLVTDNSGPIPYMSQHMFSVIEDDIRYSVVWSQHIMRNGRLIGIGEFKPLKISRRKAQILKLREDYLKRMKKNV